MKHLSLKTLAAIAAALMMSATFSSCDMMEEDMDDCPSGLYLTFKYDYNLQRADMFNDHVGSVTVYIFDEQGKLVKTQEESNVGASAPLKSPSYAMHVTDLAPGKYQFIALAGQRPYADMMADSRARFVRTDMPDRADMTQLGIQLDRTQTAAGMYDIVNNSLPLDTLWHGMLTTPVEVYSTSIYKPTYATIPLVRDTKKINVTLREIDDPTLMDINKYDMTITDRNSTLLWDNSVDETTGTVVYRPHATWNSEDRTPAFDHNGDPIDGVGYIGHADFMTSRIIYHDDPADDGVRRGGYWDENGYEFYEDFFKHHKEFMKEHFMMGFEINYDQEEKLTELVEKYFDVEHTAYSFSKDFYGKMRFLFIFGGVVIEE